MATTYPYWDAENRYIVAAPCPVNAGTAAGFSKNETPFAQIYSLPNGSYWQARCFGSTGQCPVKLGPFFAQLDAQTAMQNHCQSVHHIQPPP